MPGSKVYPTAVETCTDEHTVDTMVKCEVSLVKAVVPIVKNVEYFIIKIEC